jgi:predicted nuclease with TOPRIM domain
MLNWSDILVAFGFVIPLSLIGVLFGLSIKRLQRKFNESEQFGQKLGKNLDSNVSQLHNDLSLLKSENIQLKERLKNLETIVTSTSWDSMHNESASTGSGVYLDDIEQPTEIDDAEKAAQLARRIR